MGYEYIAKDVGKRLKEIRKKSGKTQQQMSDMLGMSIKHYGAVERGITGFSLENWGKVCESLGVSLDYLIFGNIQNDKSNNFMRKYGKRLEKLSREQYTEFDKIMDIVLRGFGSK